MSPRALPIRIGPGGAWLALGLLLWALAAWPLPRIFSAAIPYTNLNPEPQTVRPIAPGDHLQLLYHFWLGLDALAGRSPPFHNVYEFNLGDDSARLQPDLYYLPFSLVYAAVAPRAGHAAGWNAAGLASVLLGVLGLGLLARRFSDARGAVVLATLVAAALPYRWITLFTGSPTGFAMAFPPLLAYGLDRAIRDRSTGGGVLAGLALFFSYTADLHVFYFSALAAPFFAALAFARCARAPRAWPGQVRRRIRPLLPFVVLSLAAVGVGALMSRHLAGSVMAGGRSIAEVCQYSPPAIGLVSSENLGMANHVYFGVPLFVLLAAALAGWALQFVRRVSAARPAGSESIALALLFAAAAGVVLLALGCHAPWSGLPIRAARKLVPHYTMIRQTVKIYCLLPAVLAPLLALLFGGILRIRQCPGLRRVLFSGVAGLGAWTLAQALAQTSPGFCRLPRENTAYAAIAADAKANAGRPARALALPLWPGSSHWTSLYEYDVMLSRVRLVNGYAPAVPAGYFEDIFKKYESLNQGHATDAQLDGLLELGVRHLALHAHAFPEQVSPFPPAATLRALTGHPRLALIADDGQTFAFRILPKHPVAHAPHANWPPELYAAARQWNWDPALEIANAQTAKPLLQRAPVFPAPGLRYLLRLGENSAQPLFLPPGPGGVATLTQPVAGLPDWLQAELPGPDGGLVSAHAGPVYLEYALLAAGELPGPAADGTIHIPPALLFHLGHAAPGQNAVEFTPETVPTGRVLHGPGLPFPPGVYDITLDYSSPAPDPGIFRILKLPGRAPLAETRLDATRSESTFPAVTLDAAPVRFEFHYFGTGRVVLRDIRLAPATLRLAPVP